MADRIINASILKSQPKINFSANNIVKSVEVEEKTNYFVNESIFNEHFSIYNSKTSDNTDNIADYTYEVQNNNIKPYNDNIGGQGGAGLGTNYYAYYKIHIKLEKRHLNSGLTLDIIQKGDFMGSIIPMSYDFKYNIAINSAPSSHNFLKYNSILEFEEYWFKLAPTASNPNQIKIPTDKQAGYVTCGIVLGEDYADILLILLKYQHVEYSGTKPKDYSIQNKFDLNIRMDLMSTKTAVFKSAQANTKSDYVLKSNELMQVNTKINGTPIGQYIANDIIVKNKNGKATAYLTVYSSNENPLFVVEETVKVYGFDGKSILRNRDGTDKRFKITSAEMGWVGEITQNLEMVEVIE
ncbi:MAG: hypothetical protein RSB59_06560 [Clostridia bacterium]